MTSLATDQDSKIKIDVLRKQTMQSPKLIKMPRHSLRSLRGVLDRAPLAAPVIGIAIAPVRRLLIGSLFALAALLFGPLPGFAGPVFDEAFRLLGAPVILARQDSPSPASHKSARTSKRARKIAASHAASAAADSHSSSSTGTDAKQPDADPPATESTTAPGPPSDAVSPWLEQDTGEPNVDTAQFDEEARAAGKELEGRLSQADKPFDKEAAATSQPASSPTFAPPGETTPR